ncbi:hypothetical protein G4B88_008683 [Cannabis sativa]|uniref:A-kinase anchor protein 17A n=2 Tax=Cannabis sativa TaxID=3483 RepID=A0A7J6EM54_CANSA|nr:hypothetical protein G4B88_008683 [Cannabis sativa]
MSIRPLDLVTPTETFEIENGLSLVPRLRLKLTVFPASPSVTKPIDEWKVKRTLIDFLKTSLSVPITVPEEDLQIKRFKDLKKRKRDDPLAFGYLFIRDLSFIQKNKDEEEDLTAMEEKFLHWRRYIADKMDGIELNIEGLKFKLNVAVPVSDDFQGMKKAWEDFFVFGNRGYSRGGKQEPDTIVLRGVPSRWFAEPRVSSKPSMLVTHTIFSSFGKIRNLNVAEDDDLGKDATEDDSVIISGLHCMIVVQFEKYKDFYNTLKVLCCRSMQKEGSRLRADYEVTWDKDGFFQNTRSRLEEKGGIREIAAAHYRSEAPRHQREQISRTSPDDMRRKRFKTHHTFKRKMRPKQSALAITRFRVLFHVKLVAIESFFIVKPDPAHANAYPNLVATLELAGASPLALTLNRVATLELDFCFN